MRDHPTCRVVARYRIAIDIIHHSKCSKVFLLSRVLSDVNGGPYPYYFYFYFLSSICQLRRLLRNIYCVSVYLQILVDRWSPNWTLAVESDRTDHDPRVVYDACPVSHSGILFRSPRTHPTGWGILIHTTCSDLIGWDTS